MKDCTLFPSAYMRSLLSKWILSISVASLNSVSASSVACVPEFAADCNARSHAFLSLQENVKGGKNAARNVVAKKIEAVTFSPLHLRAGTLAVQNGRVIGI